VPKDRADELWLLNRVEKSPALDNCLVGVAVGRLPGGVLTPAHARLNRASSYSPAPRDYRARLEAARSIWA
jgi:hypothetical protein